MGPTLSLEESGNPVALVCRDIRQHSLCRRHVAAHNGRLVLDDRQRQGVRENVHVLVGDIDAVVRWQVAEEVDALVKVVDDVRLVANEVAQSVGAVGVDEAIANPLARLDPMMHVSRVCAHTCFQ